MTQYIDKDAILAEIDRQKIGYNVDGKHSVEYDITRKILDIINTLEVKDPYEQCIQYPSVKDGIESHAETYSFNIESELFNQLTKERQSLWRKEIEQACISGGEVGVELARDTRYKENLEVKESELPNPRFPHLDDIVEKVFGAGNLEWWEYQEAKQLVLLAKEELLKDLKAKEVDLEKEIDNVWNPHFNLGWDDNSLVSINHKSFESIVKHFFELGLKAQKGK